MSEKDISSCKKTLISFVTSLLLLAENDPPSYKFVVNRVEALGVERFVDEIFNRLFEAGPSSSCEYRINNVDLKIHLRIDSHGCIRGNVTREYEESDNAWGAVYDLLNEHGMLEQI